MDKTGYLDDAINRAIELNGLNKENIRVVKYSRQKGLFDDVLGSPLGEGQHIKFDLATLLDLTAPRRTTSARGFRPWRPDEIAPGWHWPAKRSEVGQ